MDEADIMTPALKALFDAQLLTGHDFTDFSADGDFTEKTLRTLLETITDSDIKKYSIDLVEDGLKALREANELSPKTKPFTNFIAFCLANFALNLTIDKTLKAHEQQAPKIRPLARQNRMKATVIERARTIAAEFWHADINKEIRIGAMADSVYRALATEGFTESLPDTVERVNEWIKPAAPDYARKGGRSRKRPERNG